MTTTLQTKITPDGLLSPDKILIVNGDTDKKTLIARLVRMACRGAAQLDVDEITAQVLKREEGFGTALETGLAIPHARLEELDSFLASMAVLRAPLDGESSAQTPTRVMFLFLSPGCPAFFKQHLQLLASLAQTFEPAFVAELAQSADPAQALEKITQRNMVK